MITKLALLITGKLVKLITLETRPGSPRKSWKDAIDVETGEQEPVFERKNYKIDKGKNCCFNRSLNPGL